MVDKNTTNGVAIACKLAALDVTQRERHFVTKQRLFAAVETVHPLPTGYTFQLPEEMLLDVAGFVEYVRLCGPFFASVCVKSFEPIRGPDWLDLSGSKRIKQFIKMEFSGQVNENLTLNFGT